MILHALILPFALLNDRLHVALAITALAQATALDGAHINSFLSSAPTAFPTHYLW